MRVTAAVLEGPRGRFSVEELDLTPPAPDEVLVRLVATGICHSDLLARDEHLPFGFPGVLGHEGSGVVEAVGARVTKVAPGDRVVLTLPSCGACRNCSGGHPRYCMNMRSLGLAGSRGDGSTAFRRNGGSLRSHFFGQSSFSTMTVTYERSVVPVGETVPLELLGPLGCGLATGAGAVLNALRPPVGSSIAVFGAGSVGLSAIMAAKLSGCTTICAVDLVPERLRLASELGATHVVDARAADVVSEVREAGGGSVDYSLECTGDVRVLRQAVEVLPVMRGTCGMVGGAPPGTEIALDHKLMLWGKQLRGIVGGDGHAHTFIPLLVRLFEQGSFPLDRLVTFFDLEDINAAVQAMERGHVVKPILRMPAAA